MSRDQRGNGIQKVDGSIPFGSTNSFNDLRMPVRRNERAPSLISVWCLQRFVG
jgi:hypothetical protein